MPGGRKGIPVEKSIGEGSGKGLGAEEPSQLFSAGRGSDLLSLSLGVRQIWIEV